VSRRQSIHSRLSSFSLHSRRSSLSLRSRITLTPQYIRLQAYIANLNLQDGTDGQGSTYVINLDLGTVTKTGSGKLGAGGMFNRHQPYNDLPTIPTKILINKIEAELADANMVAARGDGLHDYDSAFEFAATPDMNGDLSSPKEMNADIIRDAFVVFLADTMGDFTKYIRPPAASSNGNDKQYAKDPFYATLPYIDVYKVLEVAATPDRVAFMTELFQTQMFSYLVQQRTEKSVNDHRLLFFEEVVAMVGKIKELEEQQKLDWYDSDEDDGDSKPSPVKRLSQIYSRDSGANLQVRPHT